MNFVKCDLFLEFRLFGEETCYYSNGNRMRFLSTIWITALETMGYGARVIIRREEVLLDWDHTLDKSHVRCKSIS